MDLNLFARKQMGSKKNVAQIKPWQPIDEETLLGKEFIQSRDNGLLVDEWKHYYREAWEKLGAPQEWITNFSHLNPDDMYWHPDSTWLSTKGVTPRLLQSIRAITGGSFFDLSFSDQCLKLNILYIKKTPKEMVDEFPNLALYALNKVEIFALNYYKMQGWQGEASEGASIKFFSAQVQKYCEDRNVFCCGYTKDIVYRRTPIAPRKIGDREISLIRIAVNYCLSDLSRTYTLSLKHYLSIFSKLRPSINVPITLDEFINTCHAYGEEFLVSYSIAVMNRFMSHAGHPDLTIYKDDELALVEVKQDKDRFTRLQPLWIKDIGSELMYKITVLHIDGKIKNLKNSYG